MRNINTSQNMQSSTMHLTQAASPPSSVCRACMVAVNAESAQAGAGNSVNSKRRLLDLRKLKL